MTLKSFIDATANYKKEELFFNNRLQLDYGFLYSEDKPFIQKSDDRIYYEGKFGYKATQRLNYSAQFSFKSQFSNSYNYPTPSKPTGADETGSRERVTGRQAANINPVLCRLPTRTWRSVLTGFLPSG